jgi:hypothetical protein
LEGWVLEGLSFVEVMVGVWQVGLKFWHFSEDGQW